ncbi:hypothetical protein BI49514_02396 [Brevibacterium iodinum ATCC 49514]|uniref:Uncharacterized protein n=1 Tax=Brevibacterium iodinum ATCC 49514 TaxID=1255616 RepID=A0A2H1JV31_9MICO|nr:hypothetical protein [Brevibacterium iodinum]SMX91395.1 hypothetical protein BI49514_02396 [Brevibacterium iodinum ATCC 49514]SUW70170.1 Uncharacterised protein [Brevibacterium iodinum]
MLEDITAPVTQLNTVAAWFLGSALALAVVGCGVMLTMWLAGKSFSIQEWSKKGQVGVGLFFVGVILLGSIGGGIQWSSSDSKTEGLLPEAAKQKTIRVDRKPPHSKCTATVSISSKKHMKAKKDGADNGEGKNGLKYQPSEAEASKMGKAIREIGAHKWNADKAWTKSLTWKGNHGDLPSKDDWKKNRSEYEKKHEPMYSRIQWQPDGKKGNCDNTNFNAAKGAPVEVIFFEKFMDNDPAVYGYRKFTIPVK